MKALIIGGAGFVGAYLMRYLKEELHMEVTVTKMPQEQIEEFAALHPDCELNTTVWSDPTSEGWRVDHVDPYTNQVYYDERYEKLIEQFGYLEGDYSFASKDPKYKAG